MLIFILMLFWLLLCVSCVKQFNIFWFWVMGKFVRSKSWQCTVLIHSLIRWMFVINAIGNHDRHVHQCCRLRNWCRLRKSSRDLMFAVRTFCQRRKCWKILKQDCITKWSRCVATNSLEMNWSFDWSPFRLTKFVDLYHNTGDVKATSCEIISYINYIMSCLWGH
jgi:hypothetical protein